MISIQNAKKFILSDVNVYIPKGVVVGVIGPSGAGKTTLLKLISGILESDKGSIKTVGMDPVKDRKKLSYEMRAHFADRTFFDGNETVIGQFRLLEAIYRQGDKQSRLSKSVCHQTPEQYWQQYNLLADQLDFKSYEETHIKYLSLGQQRRVQLAFMLLGNPKLLLFDEPSNGLDEQGKQIFWQLLKQKKEAGTTIVISSHNMAEVEQLCDRILLLDEGKILYYGDREQLMRRYAPINQIEIEFDGAIPDMEDLPLLRYSIEKDILKLEYNSNHISAPEIMQRILEQTTIVRVNIIRQNLADVILRRENKV